jgi:outer membrane protein TolC
LKDLNWRLALYSVFFLPLLQADTLTDAILTPNKSAELKLERQKVDAEASIERDSWLNPIMGSYSASYKTQFGVDQENYNATVGIDQPIFKSGGIYFAIKYANAKAYYNRLGITLKRNGVIKKTIESAMKLRQLDLSIKQASLEIEDAKSEVAFLQDQLSVGEVDGATLDKAVVALNSAKMKRIDLQNSKRDMQYQFSILSDKDYRELTLPKLTIIDKASYLEKNVNVKQSLSKSKESRYWKNVVISNYLPAVNLQLNYNYQEGINQTFSETFTPYNNKSSYTNFGFKVSMPLFDVNMLKSVESARVDYLKSKINIDQVRADEKLFYDTKLAKVRAIEEKKQLCLANYNLYEKIFMTTQNSYKTGDVTALDLQKSRHQWEIKEMEIKKVYFDQQIELLSLYEKLHDI